MVSEDIPYTDTPEQAGQDDSMGAVRGWLYRHSRTVVLGYPLLMLLLFFIVPFALLVAVSFFPKPSGGYYSVGFTLSHYVRLFTTSLYLTRLVFTIELAGVTAFACLALGYPIAYSLARMESQLRRRAYITTIVSTMWLTYIIRAYAWGVILSKSGVLNEFLIMVGIIDKPLASAPGLWAVIIGMTYVFLPFAILTIYSSINNINPELEEASMNLGANRLQTFWKITLPLSRNGIYAAWMLVFILALGSYIIPRLLGNPSQWTLPIVITQQVLVQLNVPFGAALSLVMMILVIILLGLGYRYVGVRSGDLTGNEGDSNV
jgi:putative spermidine/putrescine transport system permease protein